MILIEETKYSCIECIRGHRSSSCRHHTRPLLQVRSKGRPNVHANGNPNHRIAVFAEEIAKDSIETSQDQTNDLNKENTTKGGCKNKKNPVIILKTSPKQVIDLTNGEIIGLYEEGGAANNKKKPPAPVINSSSFINTSSCCSNGIKKPSKSCGCSVNKSKSIGKSKILRTYLQNQLKEHKEEEWKFIEYSKNLKVKFEPKESTLTGDNAIENLQGKVFDVISIPSCSIPGTCCCNDDCSCEVCEVHNGKKTFNTNNNNAISSELDINNTNNLQTNENIVFNTLSSTFNQPQNILSYSTNHNHPEISVNPYLNHHIDNGALENFANIFYNYNYNEEDSPSTSNVCLCPDDSCDCSNCETHGIINGMKLDDIFQSNCDPKLFSMLMDETNEQTSWSGPEVQIPIVEDAPKSSGCCRKVNAKIGK